MFWSDPSLKRVSISGGVPTTVCQTTPAPYGIDWSRHGIVFVQPGAGIMRVSATGSTPELLVGVTARDGVAHGPQLLPDGDTLLFTLARPETTSANAWDNAQVVAHSLKTGRRKTLVDGASDGRYLPTGHLVYMVGGTLMAASFDASGLQITSEAVPVVEGIRRSAQAIGGATQYAVSSTGVLVYVPGPTHSLNDDVVFLYDRKDAVTRLHLPRGSYSHPRASPDGKWLAIETSDGRQAAVSLFELSGANSVRRLTFGGNNRMPIWSPDGTHVVFQSDRDGDRAIFWQPVNGGTAERLTRPEPGTSHVPESWSPKGDIFLYSVTKELNTSLWTFSIRDRQSARFGDVASSGVPTNAMFSPPDGRWVAYQSGESATGEAIVYVEPVPPTGTKFEIGRGGRPLWSRDGRELFFVPGPNQFSAVSVRTEPSFGFTPPQPVIRRFGLAPPQNPRPYDILPDGRFVAVDVFVPAGDQRSPAIQVVLNWFEDLKRRVPAPK